jgi:hypothetical protein
MGEPGTGIAESTGLEFQIPNSKFLIAECADWRPEFGEE